MNHLKIEVPEGKALTEGKITLNGVELTGILKLSVGVYPHRALPIVTMTMRADSIEVVNALIETQVEDPV